MSENMLELLKTAVAPKPAAEDAADVWFTTFSKLNGEVRKCESHGMDVEDKILVGLKRKRDKAWEKYELLTGGSESD